MEEVAMDKEMMHEPDVQYVNFLTLFSRLQSKKNEYYLYYEWYKNYGDFDAKSKTDKYGRSVADISKYTDLTYEKLAFQDLKTEFEELAKNGSLHATMLYLFTEDPRHWDKTIVSHVEKLETEPDKTPEMYGCIAGLHKRDYAVVFGDGNLFDQVKNVYDICNVISDRWFRYNLAACKDYNIMSAKQIEKAEESINVSLHCYEQLLKYSPKFCEAMKEMQKAYYKHIFSTDKKHRNYFDIYVYLKTKDEFPNELFAPGFVSPKELMEFSNGKYYSFGRFATMLNRDRSLRKAEKMLKKDETLKLSVDVRNLELASAALLIGNHDFGVTSLVSGRVLKRAQDNIEKYSKLKDEARLALQPKTENQTNINRELKTL